MKKLYFFLSILFLFTSCNFSLFFADKQEMPADNSDDSVPVVFNSADPVRYLRASEADYTDGIQLMWAAVSGADEYVVERAELPNPLVKSADGISEEGWVPFDANPLTNSMMDKSTCLREANNGGGAYFAYRVKAHNLLDDSYTPYSNIAFGTILAKVNQISASKGSEEKYITLTWNQVPGAAAYNIYKSEDKSFTSTDISPVNPVPLPALQGSEKNTWKYAIGQGEAGKTLFFAVKSISLNNSAGLSAYSSQCFGYTYKPGSPDEPEIKVSKGDHTGSIDVKIKLVVDTMNPVSYQISRSAPGAGETIIYPYDGLEEADMIEKQTPDGGGFVTFSDVKSDANIINDNTEYTYYVCGINNIGTGRSTADKGYLLSPPKSVALTPVKTGTLGYRLEVEQPLGGDDMKYEITVLARESGEVSEPSSEISYSQIALDCFYPIASDTTGSEYQNEVRKVVVCTVNPDTNEKSSPVVVEIGGVAEPLASLSASANYFKSSLKASSDGIYPVVLSWTNPAGSNPDTYHIVRSDGTDLGNVKKGTLEYKDSTVEIGKTYDYTVTPCDLFGRSKGGGTTATGAYGAITKEKFAQLFENNCLKPWEHPDVHPEYQSTAPYNSLYNYIKQAGTGSLGTTTVNGQNRHGDTSTIYYNAKINGIGGYVTFKYHNFGECEYMYIKGDAQFSMDVSASGDGSVVDFTKPFDIAGMYPGTIDFSALSVKGQKFAGKYVVKMKYCDGSDAVSGEVTPQ